MVLLPTWNYDWRSGFAILIVIVSFVELSVTIIGDVQETLGVVRWS